VARPARSCFNPRVSVTVVGIAVVVAGLAVHLGAEATGHLVTRAISKVAASAGFVAVGLAVNAGGRHGALVLAGLLLSAVGDALLLSSRQRAFLAGIGAFLLAHVAYAVAFAPSSRPSVPVAAALALAALAIVRWLWPHLGALRVPVIAYAAAITAMLLLALGVESALVRSGAALFYLSDLTVARDRFVREGLVNRLVGLPLYYAAQVLLALSTAAAP
jgi:uncharacterized membrane protein YhhN